jgi:membrane associated rhomboid family serine protease
MITSMFLHANLMHLLGNMWFLYLFGDNVEARMGHLRYLICYLLCGIAGDMSHFAFFHDSDIPSIGASGAIFGVLGMYFVLFPFNRVKVFYWIFIIIGTVAVPAVWVIGSFFVLELLYSHLQTVAGAQSGIGHLAHSGGFIAGALLAMLMLLTRMVGGRRRDLLSYLSGNAAAESPAQEVPQPARWTAVPSTGPAERVEQADPHKYDLSEHDPRYEIVALLHAGRLDRALQRWREFAVDNIDGVLPVREQFEIAMALDRASAKGLARDAYERLLGYYPNHQPYTAEAQLALAGMLLQQAQETGDRKEVGLARRLLKLVAQNHPDANRRELATRWMQAAEGM